MIRIVLVIAILAGSTLGYWLWTRPGGILGPQDLTWRRVQINRDLWVAIDPSYPPFAEWTPDEIIGLEPDLAREIGRRLGVEAHILIMGYDSLYDSLYTGSVDMVIAGLHVDTSQTEWVHYTRSYYDAGQVLVSLADHPIQTMRELDGQTVAVELASAGEMAARQWERRLHALTITRYVLPDEAMQAVLDGKAEAALVDTVSARLFLKQHPDLIMATKTTAADQYVVAMRKANYRLIEAVDRIMADMAADGTLDTIIARWL
jgi:polar amino acid transport system substrate-binding protein